MNRSQLPGLPDDVLTRLDDLLERLDPADHRGLLREILATAAALARDDADELDLKITAAALKEMREAFRVFAPHRHLRKVTIFGSARTRPEDPLYGQARSFASAMAERGWMVVTGAGPGIMSAGIEGAGRERSLGVSIRLPFEQSSPLVGDSKYVSMKYFFTRKLMLIKESAGFVSLPGGFGTLDETFELITLVQTGKAVPAPIVFLDIPGGTYWRTAIDFVRTEVCERGLASLDDLDLFLVTDDVATAVAEIMGFYANFDSIRYVGDLLVVRIKHAPTDDELARLNDEFSSLCRSGRIERSQPLRPEVADADKLDLHRLAFRFDPRRHGVLRRFIDALNDLVDPVPLPAAGH